MKKILMIANPGSGKGEAVHYANKLRQLIQEKEGVKVDLRETEKLGDAKKWARQTAKEDYDTLICLGGDGTVNEVISGLMVNPQPPIFAFVPLGTVNDLARSMGFSMDPDQAIEQYRQLTLGKLDVGKVNDHYFVNVLALGTIPSAVLKTDSEEKNKLGPLAYLLDSLKAIFKKKPLALTITFEDGSVYKIQSDLLLVTLTSSVGGVDYLLKKEHLADGKGRLFAFQGDIASATIQTLFKNKGLPDSFTYNDNLLALQGREFRIELQAGEVDYSVKANIDGDEGPGLPLSITILPQALEAWFPNS